MSVFSDPISPSETDPSNPVVYAPLTLSGIVVAFNIDRDPALVNGAPNPSEVPLDGTQVQNIYLTPRLMAKLLTESYKDERLLVDTEQSVDAGGGSRLSPVQPGIHFAHDHAGYDRRLVGRRGGLIGRGNGRLELDIVRP